jgi:hypothetical protein
MILAVRAGGKGDVTKTHIVWQQKAGASHCSPVLVGERIVWVSGQVWCVKAKTGEIVYQKRLYDGPAEYVSPVAADGREIVSAHRRTASVAGLGRLRDDVSAAAGGDAGIGGGTGAAARGCRGAADER